VLRRRKEIVFLLPANAHSAVLKKEQVYNF
jgi:hypothetical protein